MSVTYDQCRLLYERGQMMENLKAYMLSVMSAVTLCALLLQFAGTKGSLSSMIHLLTALFLTFTALKPLLSIKLSELEELQWQTDLEAIHAVSEGESMAKDAVDAIIKENTEAYILEKAASLGFLPQIDVTITEHKPTGIQITGTVSPYFKSHLSEWLSEMLDIPLEEQIWLG